MIGWWERWNEWLKAREAGASGGGVATRVNRGLILVAICGVILMVLGNLGGPRAHETATPPPNPPSEGAPLAAMSDEEAYVRQLESRLETMINQIAGVSDAQVFITPDTGREQVFAEEVETDQHTQRSADGTTTDTEARTTSKPVTISSSGQEQPIVRYVKEPVIRGVLVVARGASDPAVRLEITHAVATVLNLPAYRVAVYERG